MKRTLRFVITLALLLGLMAMGQSAMTGACDGTSEQTHPLNCPD
ncbi:MAG TPA: hypothetical protein VD973_17015 [Symbiobacteriaceae bacterium]|nr:hypothetical protein [Symbiobacteriaceae bacterium]